MTSPIDLQDRCFGTYMPRARAVLDVVRAIIEPDRALRIVDIGCGSGEAIADLHRITSLATFTGIDISASNIATARMGLDDERVTWLVGDYRTVRVDPSDLVLADGVLHLIPGPTTTLVDKLAAGVAPGGYLVVVMPYACAYNRTVALVRRMLRIVRSPLIEAMGLWFARRLHPQVPEARLVERLVYLYVAPYRLADVHWDRILARHGLHLLDRVSMRQVSPVQLRHHLSVYRSHQIAGAMAEPSPSKIATSLVACSSVNPPDCTITLACSTANRMRVSRLGSGSGIGSVAASSDGSAVTSSNATR